MLVVALLVAPMPSNKIRGQITTTLNKIWHGEKYVQRTCWIILTLNCYYLVDAVKTLTNHNRIYGSATCESRAMALWLERNAWLCGVSIFLFFVLRRVLDIQGQLFDMRDLVKKAADSSSENGGGDDGARAVAAAPAGSEHAKSVLRQLNRAVSKVMGEEEAKELAKKLHKYK